MSVWFLTADGVPMAFPATMTYDDAVAIGRLIASDGSTVFLRSNIDPDISVRLI